MRRKGRYDKLPNEMRITVRQSSQPIAGSFEQALHAKSIPSPAAQNPFGFRPACLGNL
jgi:hypothetical protein